MSSRRWSKFWWQDWQRDPALRMCSLAARGAWIEMLCLMADAEPFGHLLVNGRAPNMRQLGSVLGCGEKEASRLVAELEENGVFSRTDDETIFSRRMVRDKAISDEAAENGKRGGNPRLKEGVNPPVKGKSKGKKTPPHKHQEAEAETEADIPPNDPPAGDQTDDAQTDLEAAIAAQKPAFPVWLPVPEWNAFIEMRRERKKPPTDHAVKLLIGALTKFRDQGHEPAAVLNRSTVNGWLDLFPLKPEHQSRQSRHAESMAGFAHIPDIEGI